MEEERKTKDAIREIELHREIDKFMEDKLQGSLSFPSTLNSWERQVIHAYCEVIKIKHESQGEGLSRFLIITKPKHLQPPP